MLVLTSEGERLLLARAMGLAPVEPFDLHLYANDIVPARTTRRVDLDEFAGQGYAPRRVPPGSWAMTREGDSWVVAAPAVRWTFSGGAPQRVTGAFLTGARTGRVYGAERFDEPYLIAAVGEWIEVEPALVSLGERALPMGLLGSEN